MLIDFKILSQRDSSVNLQYRVIKNATIPQIPGYTVPCDLSLVTTPVPDCRLFSDINISQGIGSDAFKVCWNLWLLLAITLLQIYR